MDEVEDAKALQERVHALAEGGEAAELRSLLEEHPEVDVDGHKDHIGRRALSTACHNGHIDCAQLLIEHRAYANAKDNLGGSALLGAAEDGYLNVVELLQQLLQHGADVNCQHNNGLTILTCAALNGYLTFAQYLLEQKADVHYRISAGSLKNMDALHLAKSKYATGRPPGTAFAFLSCGTDAKNVHFQGSVSSLPICVMPISRRTSKAKPISTSITKS
jgi:hypothetical protein